MATNRKSNGGGELFCSGSNTSIEPKVKKFAERIGVREPGDQQTSGEAPKVTEKE